MKNPTKPVLFLLCNNKRRNPKSQIFNQIPFIDVINWTERDKEGNLITRERKIRYIPGATSIFADEQPDYYDSKWEKKDMRPKSLLISNGQIEVLPSQILLFQFLSLCNFNKSNPSRRKEANALIEVYDPEAISKANNEKRNARIDAEATVRNMDVNQLRAHLVTMTNGTSQAINRYREMEEQQLRDVAYLEANKDAIGFMASFQNPATKNKYIIINAVLRGIITFNEITNTLTWSNGEVIMTSANGMNAIDALAELSINSPKHQAIIDDLVGRMSDRMTPAEKESAMPKMNTVSDPYEALIEACIQAKIISFTHPWYTVNLEKGAPDGEKPLKFQQKNNMKEGLKANGKKLYLELMDRLEKSTVTA